MNTAIIVAVIAASITAIGWVANYIFTTFRDRQQTATEENQKALGRKIEFTTHQIEELYAPLSALLLDSQCTYKELLLVLGIPFEKGADARLPDENDLFDNELYRCQVNKHLDAWVFWIENDFFPRNEEIKKLIVSKVHLIDEDDIPQTFLDLLAHYSSWKVKHERWKQQKVKYNWHSDTPFPQDFRKEVIKKLQALKKQHTTLLGQANISKPEPID